VFFILYLSNIVHTVTIFHLFSFFQNQLLSWISGADREERGNFLRRYLDILPADELQTVSYLVANAKKRRKRVHKPEIIESAPKTTKSVFESAPTVPQQKGWWRKYKKCDVFSMDVEKVEKPVLEQKSGKKPKYSMFAAEVSVVNSRREVVYSKKIFHERGSFRVNPHAKNGFKSSSLINGTPLEVVKQELRDLFTNKLVVLLSAEGDFTSLDLPMSDFNVFDLQWQWYAPYILLTIHTR